MGFQIKWSEVNSESFSLIVWTFDQSWCSRTPACLVAQHWHYHCVHPGQTSGTLHACIWTVLAAWKLFNLQMRCYLTLAHRVQLLTFEDSENVMCTLVGGLYPVSLTPGASVYCVYRAPIIINGLVRKACTVRLSCLMSFVVFRSALSPIQWNEVGVPSFDKMKCAVTVFPSVVSIKKIPEITESVSTDLLLELWLYQNVHKWAKLSVCGYILFWGSFLSF